MNIDEVKAYYGREEIQKALLNFAKNREIGVMFDGYFGKRPSVIEYLSDVKNFVKKGVFSFHTSEERWANPLLLGTEKNEDERAKNRVGWDLILDLDGLDFKYSKIVANIILNFLENLNVKNVSIKFSGNKGFHIGVPFEAFSSHIIGFGETSLLFPEVARRIAAYLMHELRGRISKEVLESEGGIENIAKKYNLSLEELTNADEVSLNFEFMKVIEIDTILISSRHLFRMPYSLNEKSGLVSIPVKKDYLNDFEKFLAKPERVDPKKYEKFEFLAYNKEHGKDADILLTKSYEDDYLEMVSASLPKYSKGEFVFEITEETSPKDFPQTIQYLLKTPLDDGRKRAVFLLLGFLRSINYTFETVEQIIKEWNELQKNPLKTGYIKAQLSWFKAQQKVISPPNFSNDAYYKGIGIPEELINKDRKRFKRIEAKNPLHYVYLLTKSRKKK